MLLNSIILATTFQNSIMFISKRIDVLEKLYAKEETERVPGEEEMKSLQKIVETLSLCAVNLSTVIKVRCPYAS